LYPVRIAEEVIGIGIITVDITERKATEMQLKALSERDPLTGIFNRRQFLVELDRMVRYAARYHHAGAVLMLDVDNFNPVGIALTVRVRLRPTGSGGRRGGAIGRLWW